MNEIILIQGKVKYQINLDPSLWIFDDRRFEMSEQFPGVDGLGMEFGPFLKNAEPAEDATKLVIHQRGGGRVILPLEHAYNLVFSLPGQASPSVPTARPSFSWLMAATKTGPLVCVEDGSGVTSPHLRSKATRLSELHRQAGFTFFCNRL